MCISLSNLIFFGWMLVELLLHLLNQIPRCFCSWSSLFILKTNIFFFFLQLLLLLHNLSYNIFIIQRYSVQYAFYIICDFFMFSFFSYATDHINLSWKALQSTFLLNVLWQENIHLHMFCIHAHQRRESPVESSWNPRFLSKAPNPIKCEKKETAKTTLKPMFQPQWIPASQQKRKRAHSAELHDCRDQKLNRGFQDYPYIFLYCTTIRQQKQQLWPQTVTFRGRLSQQHLH